MMSVAVHCTGICCDRNIAVARTSRHICIRFHESESNCIEKCHRELHARIKRIRIKLRAQHSQSILQIRIVSIYCQRINIIVIIVALSACTVQPQPCHVRER